MMLTSSYSRELIPSDLKDNQFIAADKPPPQASHHYQLSGSIIKVIAMAKLTIDDCYFARDDLIQLVLPKLLGNVLLQLFGVSEVRKISWVLEEGGRKV